MGLDTHAYNDYIASLFAPPDSALTETLTEMEQEGIPGINVSGTEGKLLQVLALAVGAKRILEVGNAGRLQRNPLRPRPAGRRPAGHPGDRLTPRRGRAAGTSSAPESGHKVEIRVGPASETLRRMAEAGEPPFDLIFIDADKGGYAEYLSLCLPAAARGRAAAGRQHAAGRRADGGGQRHETLQRRGGAMPGTDDGRDSDPPSARH